MKLLGFLLVVDCSAKVALQNVDRAMKKLKLTDTTPTSQLEPLLDWSKAATLPFVLFITKKQSWGSQKSDYSNR